MAIVLIPISYKIKCMKQQLINSAGDLNITPSDNSSNHDFDFFFGKWKIHNRKLKTRLNNCTEWIQFEAKQEKLMSIRVALRQI